MKFICNRYIVCFFTLFIVSKYVIFFDYKRYVEQNVDNIIAKVDAKFDKAKLTLSDLNQIKNHSCEEMMLPLQRVVALNPMINSISFIRDGRYYCSSIVGMNISIKDRPNKEIIIKEKNLLTGMPNISYYHRYDENNGIQFYMKGIPFELVDSRIGSISLSDGNSVLSEGNTFGVHQPNQHKGYPSEKYDFFILLNYDRVSSFRNYIIDNSLIIIISLLMVVLAKTLSVKSVWFNCDFHQLKRAIRRNQIKPYIQPIVNGDEIIIGGEILARWVTPSGEIISPLVFISKMEKLGLISELTKSLLSQLNEHYQYYSNPDFKVSVNLTESCLYDEAIYALCRALSTKLTLVLEFTETTEFEDRTKIAQYMEKFRRIGVKFALDDYGTGYSSLQYLNYYQFDFVKVDKSFIDNIETNRLSLKILENIILLANNLDISLVAEGVETRGQKQILDMLDIAYQQGFLYFKPMPLTEFTSIVKEGKNS